MLRVAIIGGYGNFGSHVARKLADHADIQLIIAGRSLEKAKRFISGLEATNPPEAVVYDMRGSPEALAKLRPDLVLNMVGPYNGQSYAIAEASIACEAHYCDIADARDFVVGIGVLDDIAEQKGVAVLAGASSVPALTAAYCDEALNDMHAIHSLNYGISGAEQSNRGTGTVAAVLSFVGQTFTELRDGKMVDVTGWSGTHRVQIPQLGNRWFGKGNIPDLSLFKERYPTLRNQAFWAGHEIALIHWAGLVLGKLVKSGLLSRLERLAPTLARISRLFFWLGDDASGFFMEIGGVDDAGNPLHKHHYIVARQGHGPYIPCIPPIVIAKKLAAGEEIEAGARPCLGVITLDEYRAEFVDLDIEVFDQ